MIEDRTPTPKPSPRDWAVFRYGLISEATRPLASEVASEILGPGRRAPTLSSRRFAQAFQHLDPAIVALHL